MGPRFFGPLQRMKKPLRPPGGALRIPAPQRPRCQGAALLPLRNPAGHLLVQVGGAADDGARRPATGVRLSLPATRASSKGAGRLSIKHYCCPLPVHFPHNTPERNQSGTQPGNSVGKVIGDADISLDRLHCQP